MSYKFDMSEYDKPLKEASSIDSDMSVSAAKENALKNLEIAEKFIKKVSTKTTDAQKKFIEERIADARREIQEAAKGIDPRDKEPYLLPTAKDLGKDNMQSYDNTNNRTEKPNSFKTIHFIRNESPAFGSGEDSYKFDTNIPIDAIRRIQEIEERIKRDVETVVKGNDRTQEVTRTVYVENEADPILRAEIMDLQVKNTDLRHDIAALQAELEYQQANSAELQEQIDGHLATITENDNEIDRLIKILYGNAARVAQAPVVPRAPVVRLPLGAPYPAPATGTARHAGQIMVTVPSINAGMPFELGTTPHTPFNAVFTPADGLFNHLASEIKTRDDKIDALTFELDDAKTDPTLTVPAVSAPSTGGVPAFAGSMGLYKGLRQRTSQLRDMVDELSAMIETPDVLAANAATRAQEITDYHANIASKADYDAEVAAYQAYQTKASLAADWDAYDAWVNHNNWYMYEEEKFLTEQLTIALGRGSGAPRAPFNRQNRKDAKNKLAGRDIPYLSPWKTLRDAGKAWARGVEETKITDDASMNDPIVLQMANQLFLGGVVPAGILPLPAIPGGMGRPAVPPGRILQIHSVAQPVVADPRPLPVPALTDPAVSALSATVKGKLRGDLADGKPGHPATGAVYVATIDALQKKGVPHALIITIGGFRAQLDNMTTERDALLANSKTQNAEITRLNAEIAQLTTALATMTTSRDQLNETLYGAGGSAANVTGGVQGQLNTATAEIAQLTAEKAAIQAAVTTALGNARIVTSADLPTDIANIGQEAARLISEVQRLAATNATLTQQLADVTAKLQTAEAKLQTTEARLRSLISALRKMGVKVNEGKNDELSFRDHNQRIMEATWRRMRLRAEEISRAGQSRPSAAAAASFGADSPFLFTNQPNKVHLAALNGKISILDNLIRNNVGIIPKTPDWEVKLRQLKEKLLLISASDDILQEILIKQEMIQLLEQRFQDQSIPSTYTEDKIVDALKLKADAVIQRRNGLQRRDGTPTQLNDEEKQLFRNLLTLRAGTSNFIEELEQLNEYSDDITDMVIYLVEEQIINRSDIPEGFITAMIKYVTEGKKKPNVDDPSTYAHARASAKTLTRAEAKTLTRAAAAASAAAAAKPVTGGGYFDGGSYKTKRRMKISGGDGENGDIQDNVDVMLTAGVGGAVGSIMWLGWGGLVIFLLLLFIFYLGDNIYNDSCSNSSNLTNDKGLRKYRRELHKRK